MKSGKSSTKSKEPNFRIAPKTYSLRTTQKPQKPRGIKERSLESTDSSKEDRSDAGMLKTLKEKNDQLIEMLRKEYPNPEDQKMLGIYQSKKKH
ncbi:hypothetical protein TVAG_202860 [Trichomonas vaginalis G3]|uniref:Uncharacterized protein n=1 Tax=Trichomonas vaginalis (strain ATCC PRA-98 / G3) TaxID=412133 RepID=A2ENF8_TRIV3|nr:hypothetical protein TVAGG3_0491070 [Trichomonas vaginalis G3]EAY05828.1 hypothetical protein TVAG_202860 [Trichomonas vaginalis G3]KAI5516379.1 hypothetical protein TVAGG3_0491070 [Trichomonas vaginalis G3]|eukprot:XP_001318051.1 hypothetical protein [Trichomonas vaginalis G3]